MEKERKITEDTLQPLQLQLVDLDEQLKESKAKIGALKSKISKNDVRLDQILQGVVQS